MIALIGSGTTAFRGMIPVSKGANEQTLYGLSDVTHVVHIALESWSEVTFTP